LVSCRRVARSFGEDCLWNASRQAKQHFEKERKTTTTKKMIFLQITLAFFLLNMLMIHVQAVAVSPYDGCGIRDIIEPNSSSPLNILSHGGDPLQLRDTDATSFSCVDARHEHPIIGAFAGDIGEFLLGLDVFSRKCQNPTERNVYRMLRTFVQEHTTPLRPFYMHTDDTRLAALLDAMGADKFPDVLSDPAVKQQWYNKLLQDQVRYHGCGHIWYQVRTIQKSTSKKELTKYLDRFSRRIRD
jgi:hypothetical protein